MIPQIPEPMLKRMKVLEKMDARDRQDGTPHLKRLRQITPGTGLFLSLLVESAQKGEVIELGTSAGYSTLWLILGLMAENAIVRTYEVDQRKINLAQETFRLSEVERYVELLHEDAVSAVDKWTQVGFCFMDLDKGYYLPCYEHIVPRLVEGGLLVADNTISHESALSAFLEIALQDERVDALVLPIGRGQLICRKKAM